MKGTRYFPGRNPQRTFLRTVGSLDQVYPLEYNTCRIEHISLRIVT